MSSITERRSLRLFGVLVLDVICLSLFALSSSYATDYYWTDCSGSWGDASNWNPNGVPGTQTPPTYTDNAYLLSSDAVNRTVDVGSGYSMNSLTVDATGGGTMTLSLQSAQSVIQPLHGLSVGVGGIVNQADGAVSSGDSGQVIDGVYNLGGGWDSIHDVFYLRGTFNQTGGVVSSLLNADIHGTYNLINGQVGFEDAFIETFGGTFNQQGGQVSITAGLEIISGTYNLCGGILSAGYVSISHGGSLNVCGGTLYTDHIYYYPAVPEPSTMLLLGFGLVGLGGLRRKFRK